MNRPLRLGQTVHFPKPALCFPVNELYILLTAPTAFLIFNLILLAVVSFFDCIDGNRRQKMVMQGRDPPREQLGEHLSWSQERQKRVLAPSPKESPPLEAV